MELHDPHEAEGQTKILECQLPEIDLLTLRHLRPNQYAEMQRGLPNVHDLYLSLLCMQGENYY